jgi:hypothetical protein
MLAKTASARCSDRMLSETLALSISIERLSDAFIVN